MAASSHRIMLGPLVAAIDQGTSSTRFLVRAAPGWSSPRRAASPSQRRPEPRCLTLKRPSSSAITRWRSGRASPGKGGVKSPPSVPCPSPVRPPSVPSVRPLIPSVAAAPGGWRRTPRRSCSRCTSAWSARARSSPSSTSTSPTSKVLEAPLLASEELLGQLKFASACVCSAIGVTNQRETTLVWDKETGEPLYNAIVWLDLRTQSTVERLINKTPGRNKNHLKHRTGLPISTYFSAVKLRWLMDNVDEVREAVESHRAMFGTVDSWLIWCLTGGKSGGVHCTDVTNASRTMLFNIHTLDWDPELCSYFGIPMEILPRVRSSSEIYGLMKSSALSGIPISGVSVFPPSPRRLCVPVKPLTGFYDDSAWATSRRRWWDRCASRTDRPKTRELPPRPPPVLAPDVLWSTCLCLFQLRDRLFPPPKHRNKARHVRPRPPDHAGVQAGPGPARLLRPGEKLAASVGTSYGCYFVPAFSGLYAPYWEPSARGIICGLTQFTNRSHVAFAALEAVCFQTREILDAMNQDSGIPLTQLQVDGGMTSNRLLMQLQADILCIPVVKPSMPETTALGAAMAAGAAEGVSVWSLNPEDLSEVTSEKFEPQINTEGTARPRRRRRRRRPDGSCVFAESEFRYARWKKAVQKSMNWETTEPVANGN
ncbi:unnamed protein product, partial [Tetraodon nigroviridis]